MNHTFLKLSPHATLGHPIHTTHIALLFFVGVAWQHGWWNVSGASWSITPSSLAAARHWITRLCEVSWHHITEMWMELDGIQWMWQMYAHAGYSFWIPLERAWNLAHQGTCRMPRWDNELIRSTWSCQQRPESRVHGLKRATDRWKAPYPSTCASKVAGESLFPFILKMTALLPGICIAIDRWGAVMPCFPQTFTKGSEFLYRHLPLCIQVFADAYHLDTLDKILSTCAQANVWDAADVVGVAFPRKFLVLMIMVSLLNAEGYLDPPQSICEQHGHCASATMPGTLVCGLEAVDVASWVCDLCDQSHRSATILCPGSIFLEGWQVSLRRIIAWAWYLVLSVPCVLVSYSHWRWRTGHQCSWRVPLAGGECFIKSPFDNMNWEIWKDCKVDQTR